VGSFEVLLMPAALKFYKACSEEFAAKLNKCFEDLENNPFFGPHIKRLRDEEKRYRCRIGDYRIIYTVDKEAKCPEILPVDREIPKTKDVERAVLQELINGPTGEEIKNGYATAFGKDVEITSLERNNDAVKIVFNEQAMEAGNDTCHLRTLRMQVSKTLGQFPGIVNINISRPGLCE